VKTVKKQLSKAKLIRRIALGVLLVAVAGFVAYNLYASRDIMTIDQTTATVEPTTQQPAESEQPEEQGVVRTGTFESLNGYTVSGAAEIITKGEDRRLVLSDDFSSSIGPDVLVYLSKNNVVAAGGALEEPVSLGLIKSFTGSQEYILPANADEYASVVLWCRAFSVSFGAASV